MLALNDPFLGGSHLPDITTVAPVFAGQSQPIGFVATRAHHADIGGIAPGSMPVARELLQEGLVIPPIRLVRGGEPEQAAMAIIVRNSRAPEERRGDMRAQLASTALGGRRLEALAGRFGVGALRQRFAALLDHGERVVRAVLREVPDGRYEFSDRLEVGDGITIRLALEVEGDGVPLRLQRHGPGDRRGVGQRRGRRHRSRPATTPCAAWQARTRRRTRAATAR